MSRDRLVGLIDIGDVTTVWPQFAQERDVARAKPLTLDLAGEWVVLRVQISHLAVAICTLPPNGGYLEQWDYPGDTNGAADALRAWTKWPKRDRHTEAWARHWHGPLVRHNPRIEDMEPPR